MELSAQLRDTQCAGEAPNDNSVCIAIGTLLAAVARMFKAREDRMRGGPGIDRVIKSIIAFFSLIDLVVRAQQRTLRAHSVTKSRVTRLIRHFSHPPSRWAAP
ncbi:hypothetical protein [Stakelama marina]|uniref:Uncharacterized protein n=1 Tax=Stakelama marina TaxID=2826939 RepID=A0A8T4IB69_9SPHN|nr:hypothetical protein [Stakelama marina]MBR0551064.1 hypothetical protein [Stakelama marina]